MRCRQKRGQSAAGAAVFLAILTGVLIAFVILLPPQDRAELLGESVSSSGSGSSTTPDGAVVEKVLLDASPGRIDYLAQNQVNHPLPVVNIFTKTESTLLAQKPSASTKRGVFTDEAAQFSFALDDLSHTQNVLINFKVEEILGGVTISLNGEEIYSGEPVEGNSLTFPLPANLLQANNVLELHSQSVGIAFWRTHKAVLSNVKIVGDVTDVNAQEAKHVFLISETEKTNMERVILEFKPECEFTEVGKLTVRVNGREVYNGVPDCDLSLVPIEFSPDTLVEGENTVEFRTDSGTYLLTHVIVEVRLKEVDFPTYYFELSEEEFTDIVAGGKHARLTMEFVDLVVEKRANLVYNGILYPFETKEKKLIIDLSEDVVRGVNSLKVRPKKSLEVRQLKVELLD